MPCRLLRRRHVQRRRPLRVLRRYGGGDLSLWCCASPTARATCRREFSSALEERKSRSSSLSAALSAADYEPRYSPLLVARCLCDDGWGDACEQPTCPRACSGHGTCRTGGVCDCHADWKGYDCSQPRCPTHVDNLDPTSECGGLAHGVCAPSGRCKCREGWTGTACERPQCLGSPVCSARGPCLVDDATDGEVRVRAAVHGRRMRRPRARQLLWPRRTCSRPIAVRAVLVL